MTSTETPAAPSFELPELTIVDPPAPKAGRVKQTNPWLARLKAEDLDVNGKSKGLMFKLKTELAKVHIAAARRAAKELSLGLSVDHKEEADGNSTVTVAIVPKRVVNTRNNQIETPDVEHAEPATPTEEPTAEPVKPPVPDAKPPVPDAAFKPGVNTTPRAKATGK